MSVGRHSVGGVVALFRFIALKTVAWQPKIRQQKNAQEGPASLRPDGKRPPSTSVAAR